VRSQAACSCRGAERGAVLRGRAAGRSADRRQGRQDRPRHPLGRVGRTFQQARPRAGTRHRGPRSRRQWPTSRCCPRTPSRRLPPAPPRSPTTSPLSPRLLDALEAHGKTAELAAARQALRRLDALARLKTGD